MLSQALCINHSMATIIPNSIFNQPLDTTAINDFLTSLSPDVLPEPDVKSFSSSVYFNYYSLGLSLLFSPSNGYKPRPGAARADLRSEDLLLESVDIYNVATKSESALPANRKAANPMYSPFPKYPIIIARPAKGTEPQAEFHLAPSSIAKDLVSFFGEPSRKGGGGGPSGGSIGIYCEWKDIGLMVEFGGDEAKGTQAWDKGKDALWSVATVFQPSS